MFAGLLMIAATGAAPAVTARFDRAAAVREGIVAEQLRRPPSIPAEDFADALVEAEGLVSWSPQDPTRSGPNGRPAWRARHAADGREVVVYFMPGRATVCRIRRSQGGSSAIHWQAVRWCAASFGVTLPARRPAAVLGG